MQMVMQLQYAQAMEEQEKAFKSQNEMAIDERMRGRDVQELHREAMRRLQVSANKSLNDH
jgi:hypothetical protein